MSISPLHARPSGAIAHPRGVLLALAVLSTASLAACDADEAPAPECTRVPELLDAHRPCFTDDACPCGAHCALGVCAYACTTDGDCGAGSTCDRFGRCGADGAPQFAVSKADRGRIVASASTIALTSPDTPRAFEIVAFGPDPGPIRVVAPPGYDVACGADGEPGSACRFDAVDPEGPAEQVRVYARSDAPDRRPGDVVVHAAGQQVRVGVRDVEFEDDPAELRPGRYRGHVWPVAAGLGEDRAENSPGAPMARTRVPLEVVVFPAEDGVHPVRIVDDLDAVFPARAPGGRLVLTEDGAAELDLPTRTTIRSGDGIGQGAVPAEGATAHHEAHIVQHYAAHALRWQDDALSGEIETAFEGLTGDPASASLTWRIAVTRVDDVPRDQTVPTFEPDAALDRDIAADATQGFDGEQAMSAAYSDILEGLILPAVVPDDPAAARSEAARQTAAAACSLLEEQRYVALHPVGAENEAVAGTVLAGDLGCSRFDGPPGPMLPVPLMGRLTYDVGEMIAICMAELADLGAEAEHRDCVHPARVQLVVGMGLEDARRVGFGEDGSLDPASESIAHRLLQQWLGLHGFLAAEAYDADVVRARVALEAIDPGAFAGGKPPEALLDDHGYDVADVMGAALRGWDYVLHPRVASGLVHGSPEMLAEPDYRSWLFPNHDPRHADPTTTAARAEEQPLGLPVSLLTTTRRQAETLARWARDARFDPLDDRGQVADIEALSRDFLRRAWVVTALAEGLAARVAGEEALGWQAEWDLARRAHYRALERLLDELDLLGRGIDPLGIEDADLPLSRLGAQSDPVARFSASSDALIGTAAAGTTDRAIAPRLVQRAIDEMEAAGESWVRTLERDWRQAVHASTEETRIAGIERRYGEQIAGLCGQPSWNALTLLDEIVDGERTIDPDTCFLDADLEGCAPAGAEADEAVQAAPSTADVGHELCMYGVLRRELGDGVTLGYDAVDAFVDDAFGERAPDARFPFRIAGGDGTHVVLQRDGTFELLPIAFELIARGPTLPENPPAAVLALADAECASRRDATDAGLRADAIAGGPCDWSDACPTDQICDAREGACVPDPQAGPGAGRPECMLGAMGQIAIDVIGAAREVDIARAELGEHYALYELRMRTCLATDALRDRAADLTEDFNETMDELAEVKLAADIAASVASAAKDIFSVDQPWQIFGTAVSGAIGAGAETTSATMAVEMEQAQRNHDALMARIDSAVESLECRADAEEALIGVDAARLRVSRSMIALGRATAELRDAKIALGALIDEGIMSLRQARDLRVAPIATNYWLDDRLGRLGRDMRSAQRAVYLALRAVEYEYQETLGDLRAAVLSARNPYALRDALDQLRDHTAAGSVGGANPETTVTVFSVRRHLLRVADRTDRPVGEQTLTDVQRFRAMVVDPRHAVYAADGRYLGQEIPFTVDPVRAGGAASGSPLQSADHCAERLWTVNASLMGEALLVDSDSSKARIGIRKRNTFASQWCDGRDGAQRATIRPARNLFVDPLNVQATGDDLTGTTDEVDRFTDAFVDARLGVSQRRLESEGYTEGDSQVLAGRGLYGDYALYLPATSVSDGTSPGLDVDRLDDVLVRFEFVSVAPSGGRR